MKNRIRLTDRQKILLGYDCGDILDAVLGRRELARKCARGEPLTAAELELLRSDAAALAMFGCEPADAASAQGLLRKVGAAE